MEKHSFSRFAKLSGVMLVIAVLALSAFSQSSVRAGVPAQATVAATAAGGGASSGGAATTSATTGVTTGGAAATMAGTTYPPCTDTVSTMAATSPAVPTVSGTAAATMAGTPNPNPGFLGISAVQVDDCGVRVMEVTPNSGAAKAQLQVDDVIVALDGQAISDIGQMRSWVQSHKPGDTIKLTIQRNGSQMDVDVTLGAVPANLGAATLPASDSGATMPATSSAPAATMAATQ